MSGQLEHTPRANISSHIDGLTHRRGLYLREGESLAAVERFLTGYEAALADHGIWDELPLFGQHFGAWLYVTRGWSQSMGWCHAILAHCPAALEPVDQFLALAGEYMLLRPVAVARSMRAGIRYQVQRYGESPLFFVTQHSAGRTGVGGILLGVHDELHASSVPSAIDAASDESGVPRADWTLITSEG